MNATTIGASAAGVPAGETQRATVTRTVGQSLRGVWWFGLGAAAVVGAFAGTIVKTLVERGKQVEPQVSAPLKMAEGGVTEMFTGAGSKIKELGSNIGRGAQKVEGAFEERIAAVLERTQQPLRNEIQELAKKVEELSGKVAKLESKEEAPPQLPV